MKRHAFTSTALLLWSGLLIWMANFLFVYIFTALACARQFAHVELLEIGIVPVVTTLSSSAAGLLTAAVMWRAARGLQRESPTDTQSRFILFIALAAGALALIAIAWVALPPLVVARRCA